MTKPMRDLRWKRFCKVATLMVVMVFFTFSCKKERPGVPDYVGTWVALEPVPVIGGTTLIRNIITFTETGLEDVLQKQAVIDQWTDFMCLKGSITVEGNSMNVAIKEAGVYSFDEQTGLPTGILASYEIGSAEFDLLLAGNGQHKTFKSKYKVLGNQLTFQTDKNKDGDYLDLWESTVYARQQ